MSRCLPYIWSFHKKWFNVEPVPQITDINSWILDKN